MQQSTHLSFASVLFAALLPVTVWGYGFHDYRGDRSHFSYAGSAGGNRYSNSLRLQTGMSEGGYYLLAYLEGLHPEDVQIYIRHNRLVLEVAQGERHAPNSHDTRRTSRWQMRFRKQLRLPYDADWARMTTSTSDGIMEIYIPRRHQYMRTDAAPTR